MVTVKFYRKAEEALCPCGPRNLVLTLTITRLALTSRDPSQMCVLGSFPGLAGEMCLSTVLSGCGFCRWESASRGSQPFLPPSVGARQWCCAETSDFLRHLLLLQLQFRKRKALFLSHSSSQYLSGTLSTSLPGLFKRCKWDVSGRLEAGPCCSKRRNFDSFPFFLKLRILSIIATSLSESLCLERFCSAQWFASKLKLETNCKCFSAAEPVCSPGIITLITGCPGSGVRTGGKIIENIHSRGSVRAGPEGCCWGRIVISFALILSHLVILSSRFVFPNKYDIKSNFI